ncbi:MAG: hypothetical protein HYY32_07170 [Chloroflexi bacterium]|nr:hypothetical protein [Chloroflexota bacterium]
MTEKGIYETVWPRGKKTVPALPLARRLDTLEGKTVCEIWNWVFRGPEIFPAIEKELASRYPGCKFVSYEKFGSTHGGGESEVLAALSDKLEQYRCDAVISGVGC